MPLKFLNIFLFSSVIIYACEDSPFEPKFFHGRRLDPLQIALETKGISDEAAKQKAQVSTLKVTATPFVPKKPLESGLNANAAPFFPRKSLTSVHTRTPPMSEEDLDNLLCFTEQAVLPKPVIPSLPLSKVLTEKKPVTPDQFEVNRPDIEWNQNPEDRSLFGISLSPLKGNAHRVDDSQKNNLFCLASVAAQTPPSKSKTKRVQFEDTRPPLAPARKK